jgi:hypothetical protein
MLVSALSALNFVCTMRFAVCRITMHAPSPIPIPLVPRDRILGHHCDKRLESFSVSYSQSRLLAKFYLKPYSTFVLKIHFVERKIEGRKTKRKLENTRVYGQKPRLKMLFKNSISGYIFQSRGRDSPVTRVVRQGEQGTPARLRLGWWFVQKHR